MQNINQVPMSAFNALVARLGPQAAISLLNSNVTSAAAVNAGIKIPYPNFTNSAVQRAQTVNQSLRPFPQFLTIDTSQSAGDKSGHSTYNAALLRLTHRYDYGLTLDASYSFSKLLTDADTYYANGGFAEDNGNRRLEKSIGLYDQTHVFKINSIYNLPLGKGHRWMSSRFADLVAGGWRLGVVQSYSSGFPLAVTRNNPLPLFSGADRAIVSTYDNWITPVNGRFDPAKNLYLNQSVFPTQLNYVLGNETRYNPKARGFAGLNENASLAKSFRLTERFRLDFRAEAFNIFNRTIFSNPNANLDSNTFGRVTGQNTGSYPARQAQGALKLYW